MRIKAITEMLFPKTLRSRATLGVILMATAVVWISYLIDGRWLAETTRRQVSAQQYAAVSIVTDGIHEDLLARTRALEVTAAGVGGKVTGLPARSVRRLIGIPLLQTLFNDGVLLVAPDGRVLARQGSVTALPLPSLQGSGILSAIRAGSASAVGEPELLPGQRAPIIAMAARVADDRGRVVAVLVGITNLSLPNFLARDVRHSNGLGGGFSVTALEPGIILAATDSALGFKRLTARGTGCTLCDLQRTGFEGSALRVGVDGATVLASVRRVPGTDWVVVGRMPVREAFAPVRAALKQLFIFALLLTLLGGAAASWLVRWYLSPLRDATRQLRRMADGKVPRAPLPIVRDDEIGVMARSFNALLDSIRESESARRDLSQQLEHTVRNVPGVICSCHWGPDGSVTVPTSTEGIEELIGVSKLEIARDATKFLNLVHAEDAPRFVQRLADAVREPGTWDDAIRIHHPQKGVRWIAWRSVGRRDPDGSVVWQAYVNDVTDERRADEDLRIAATAFDTQEGIFITDAHDRIVRVNHAFTTLTGYSVDEVVGRTPALLKSGRHDAAFYRRMRDELVRMQHWQGEIWNRKKSGELFLEWLTISAVTDGAGVVTHYVAAFSDITSHKASAERIHHLAFYDALTNLPNRRLLQDRLNRALAASDRSRLYGAVMILDLDGFKILNDTKGHVVGDLLLVEVARRLEAGLRAGDTVARQGGDEFVVVLEGLDLEERQAAAYAEAVAEKIRLAITQPFVLQKDDAVTGEYHCTCSTGITLFRAFAQDSEELFKRADLAMYEAKSAGRNACRFFDPAMQIALEARSVLELELRHALLDEEMRLHYQLQTDASGAPIGAELLLRWQHPTRGLLRPGDFISLAEETGLIVPIGAWVLQQACAQLHTWADRPETRGLRLSVNVSAGQFREPDFVELVSRTVSASDADPHLLVLELTESLVLVDVEDTIGKMNALRALGIGFSMDDFGTGYSSLSYLQRLPLSELKIDRSFVSGLVERPNDEAIVRAIIALGRTLGLNVIAEGVETDAQLALLARHGCQAFQGYLIGRPVPLDQLEAQLDLLRAVA